MLGIFLPPISFSKTMYSHLLFPLSLYLLPYFCSCLPFPVPTAAVPIAAFVTLPSVLLWPVFPAFPQPIPALAEEPVGFLSHSLPPADGTLSTAASFVLLTQPQGLETFHGWMFLGCSQHWVTDRKALHTWMGRLQKPPMAAAAQRSPAFGKAVSLSIPSFKNMPA